MSRDPTGQRMPGMSMVIQNGFRVRPNITLEELTLRLATKARKKILAAFRKTQGSVAERFTGWEVEIQQATTRGLSASDARNSVAERHILDWYRKEAGTHSPYDFNASLSLWAHKGKRYLVPHWNVNAVSRLWDFLARDPHLVRFQYWNNADRPRHISARRWLHQGQVWKDILLQEQGWENRWQLIVCDYQLLIQLLSLQKAK